VFFRRRKQHLPADDVQFCPSVLDSQNANMSSEKSQIANYSRPVAPLGAAAFGVKGCGF
jgi:hypothetical protein